MRVRCGFGRGCQAKAPIERVNRESFRSSSPPASVRSRNARAIPGGRNAIERDRPARPAPPRIRPRPTPSRVACLSSSRTGSSSRSPRRPLAACSCRSDRDGWPRPPRRIHRARRRHRCEAGVGVERAGPPAGIPGEAIFGTPRAVFLCRRRLRQGSFQLGQLLGDLLPPRLRQLRLRRPPEEAELSPDGVHLPGGHAA